MINALALEKQLIFGDLSLKSLSSDNNLTAHRRLSQEHELRKDFAITVCLYINASAKIANEFGITEFTHGQWILCSAAYSEK